MNICGVLVHVRPGWLERVRAVLAAMPGVEVHHVTADHRMIVTVEEAETARAGETLVALHRVEGVLAAGLVYHHAEPEEEGDAAVQA